jgi:hypothetical protein
MVVRPPSNGRGGTAKSVLLPVVRLLLVALRGLGSGMDGRIDWICRLMLQGLGCAGDIFPVAH